MTKKRTQKAKPRQIPWNAPRKKPIKKSDQVPATNITNCTFNMATKSSQVAFEELARAVYANACAVQQIAKAIKITEPITALHIGDLIRPEHDHDKKDEEE